MKTKCAVFALFLHFSSLSGATWVGGTAVNDWSNSANWTMPATVPNGEDAVATFGDTANLTPTLSTDTILGTLTFDSADTYTIGGAHHFTFQSSSPSAIINMSSSGTLNFDTALTLFSLASPLNITQDSSGLLNLKAQISGGSTQLITITGTGSVVFSNTSNNYTGGTTITSGMVTATGDTLSTGTVTIDSSTLKFDHSGSFSSSVATFTLNGAAVIEVTTGTAAIITTGVVNGSGSLQLTGSGTLTLGNTSNSYSGGTTISSGTLIVTADSELGAPSGSLNWGGGTLSTTTSNFTSARSGTISGTGSTLNTNGLSDTLSGNFSGSGGLAVTGGGTLTLSGTNSYTGGTTLTATNLVGTTNSLTGTITADAMSAVTFSQSFNGTYGGALNGAGTLTTTGGGTITFSGTSGLSGTTTVQQGTLNVTGSLSNSAVTVNGGATLSGTGRVGATTIANNGTLSPGTGSASGILRTGTLIFSATSTAYITITPTSNSSVAVTGTATLTGGNLLINPISGFYAPTSTYTVMTTTNPLVTTFHSSSTTNPNFTITNVAYPGSSVVVTLKALSPFYQFPFSNQNTKAVGENINALSAIGALSPALITVLDSFVGLSDTTINDALDQMHPAPYSAFTELQDEMGAQIISLFHRKRELSTTCPCECRRFWVKPFGDSLTERRHGKEFGFTANTGGLALGFDGILFDGFSLGCGAVWDYTQFEWHGHHGHASANSVYGALYADYQIWNFYVGSALMGGADFYDTARHILIVDLNEHAKASYQTIDLVAQFNTAYYFGSQTAFFYPYANFDFLYMRTPAIHEHGAPGLNLDVRERTDSTFRTEMGLAFQIIDTNWAETLSLSPHIGIGWVNMLPIQRGRYHSNFEGEPIPFATYGWDETWNLLSLDFDLYINYRCFSFGIEYNVEMSADQDHLLYNHNGDLRFSWNW